MTFFVRGGETLHARVPEGSFVPQQRDWRAMRGEVNLFSGEA